MLRPALGSWRQNCGSLNVPRRWIQTWIEVPPNRGLIKVSGPDTKAFIQGLITNDINHLENQTSMYTVFLNRQGRVLYDAIIFRGTADQEYIIDCDKRCLSDLQKQMQVYMLRKKVQIDPLTDFSVAVSSELNLNEGIASPDPRTKLMGSRAVVHTEFADKHIDKQSSFYSLQRCQLGVAEGIEDLPPGNCFPLESNCDYMHGVSFTKGCYIGQELTARTYHTGVTRKRLMPVTFESDVSLVDKELDLVNETGKKVGKLRSFVKNYAIALVRVEEVFKAEGVFLGGIKGTVKRPEWWPVELPKDLKHGGTH